MVHELKSKSRQTESGGWVRRFWSSQSGAMTYMAVAGTLLMLIFGGIGFDLIYAEVKRTKLQNALDRAVLAAAHPLNPGDPETVVGEYMGAMLLGDALTGAVDESNGAHRRVSATGYQTMPSHFLSLLGADTLKAEGAAS